MDLRATTDRTEITDLLTRYARTVDRRNRLESSLSMFGSTQHMVSNVDNSIGGEMWLTGGWYHHRLVRSASGWLSESLIEESSCMSTGTSAGS